MSKHESRLQREINTSHTMGFVEGLETTKEIIQKDVKEAIHRGSIILLKGEKELFDIIERVGRVDI